MIILDTIHKYITKKYKESQSPKVSRLEPDMKNIISDLNRVGVTVEQMSEALDLSVTRIKYEIKQLENITV
jgi:predicted transcriptional regulator